MAWAEG